MPQDHPSFRRCTCCEEHLLIPKRDGATLGQFNIHTGTYEGVIIALLCPICDMCMGEPVTLLDRAQKGEQGE